MFQDLYSDDQRRRFKHAKILLTLLRELLSKLIKDVIRRIFVRQTKININGGPSTGLMSLATSLYKVSADFCDHKIKLTKPRYDDPKKTLTRIQDISRRLKSSRASSVKVVRKPKDQVSTDW